MDDQDRKEMFRKTFDTVAEGYDNPALRFFPESAEHISSLLDLRGDEQVLDVATGTGNIALKLAEHLPNGRVTGIDFSRGMLARAVRKAEDLNIGNVRFMEMDMQEIDFPDNHFDAAVSAFGLFFITDMEKQLSHIAGKVKPGGKIIIATFAEDAFSPLADKFFKRLEKYNVEIPPMTWKRIATEAACTELFQGANLKNVNCNLKDLGYYLKDASEWWYIICNGGFRGLISQIAAEDIERFKTEHLDEIRELSSDSGIRLEMNILFTAGTKHDGDKLEDNT